MSKEALTHFVKDIMYHVGLRSGTNSTNYKRCKKLLSLLESQPEPGEKYCSNCGSHMSLFCEAAVKERMNIKNREQQAEIERLKVLLSDVKEFMNNVVIPMGIKREGSGPNKLLKRIEQAF